MATELWRRMERASRRVRAARCGQSTRARGNFAPRAREGACGWHVYVRVRSGDVQETRVGPGGGAARAGRCAHDGAETRYPSWPTTPHAAEPTPARPPARKASIRSPAGNQAPARNTFELVRSQNALCDVEAGSAREQLAAYWRTASMDAK
jgi:hypothetical protein